MCSRFFFFFLNQISTDITDLLKHNVIQRLSTDCLFSRFFLMRRKGNNMMLMEKRGSKRVTMDHTMISSPGWVVPLFLCP